MRDLIFLAYIAAWVGLACFVNRVPFWHPRVLQHGDITIIPDQRPAGCMMLLFLGMGAMIGATLPMAISEWLPLPVADWRLRGPWPARPGGDARGQRLRRLRRLPRQLAVGDPVPDRGGAVRRYFLGQMGGWRRFLTWQGKARPA